MGIKANQRYEGTVGESSRLFVANSGTVGYQVALTCADGETDFVIWLTDKNREKAEKYLDILGVPKDKRKNRTYWELQMALDISGHEVVFGTVEEVFRDKPTVKVAWIGAKSDAVADVFGAAATFFGGDPTPAAEDEDSPF
jgi:hypothetical protein